MITLFTSAATSECLPDNILKTLPLSKLGALTHLCFHCHGDLVETLNSEIIGVKVRTVSYAVPQTCHNCAGHFRTHRTKAHRVYLTEEEWTHFRDAQVRAFGVSADAQKRITNAFSNDASLRETALVSIVPTLLSTPHSGRNHSCLGWPCHEHKCWVGKWEWVNTMKDGGARTNNTEGVPTPNIPPTDKAANETTTATASTDAAAKPEASTATTGVVDASAVPAPAEKVAEASAAPAVKTEAPGVVETATVDDTPSSKAATATSEASSQPTSPPSGYCSDEDYDDSIFLRLDPKFSNPVNKVDDVFIPDRKIGDGHKVQLSAILSKYPALLHDNKIKCVTTDNVQANSAFAKIYYKGNTAVLKEELFSKAPFKDVGSDRVYFTDRDGPTCIGPLFSPAITWDPKAPGSINTTITNRTKRKFDFNLKSSTAQRFTKASWAMIKHWFTRANILEADAEFSAYSSKPRKWSDAKFYNTIRNLEADYHIMGVDWMQKAEIAFKQGKSGRCIQNEGSERCMRNLRVMFIVEYIIFDKVAKDLNIKHDDKRVVLDRLTKRLSENRYNIGPKGNVAPKASHLCVLGIDQSSFDFSETACGLLNTEINIITKIIHTILPDSAEEWEEEMLKERKQYKMNGTFQVKDSSGLLKIMVEALKTRASGDRGTSVLNWIVEFLSTISCIFEFPDEIIEDIANGSLNRRWYRTMFSDKVVNKKGEFPRIYSFFDGCFEGDDGLVQLVRAMLSHIAGIENNFHDLGLDCTLEHSTHGSYTVVEFVGCHLLVDRTGKTYWGNHHGGAFVPCINKALLKSSWTLSKGKLADVASSAYWSRMLQFAGKSTWMAGYFRHMSHAWGGAVKAELMDVFAGVDDSDSTSPLPDNIQRELLMLSTGAVDSRGFEYYEHNHLPTDNAGDIIYDFPLGFQNALRDLCNVPGATHKHGQTS